MARFILFLKPIKWIGLFVLFSYGLIYALNYGLNVYNQSFLIPLIEEVSSNPNRLIQIEGLKDVLSSKPTAKTITIADKNGIWLRLKNVSLNWQFFALLKGNIHIYDLNVEDIDFVRLPTKDIFSSSSENNSLLSLSFPLSLNLDNLQVKTLSFRNTQGELLPKIRFNGALSLHKAQFYSHLFAKRLDNQGRLDLNASYQKNTNDLALNLQFHEQKDGILSNLLALPNRPELNIKAKSEGNLQKFLLNLDMSADHTTFLKGVLTSQDVNKEKKIKLTLDGQFASLIPKKYLPFFGPESQLNLEAMIPQKGGLDVKQLTIKTPSVDAKASAVVLNDGFLRKLYIDTNIENQQAIPLLLPISKQDILSKKIHFSVHYGNENEPNWQGKLDADMIKVKDFSAKKITLLMGGLAENLDDSKKRHITINMNGTLDGIASNIPKLADALQHTLNFRLLADLKGQTPIAIKNAALFTKGAEINLNGHIKNNLFMGDINFIVSKLSTFDTLFHKQINGTAFVKAKGTVALRGGGFQLDLTGNSHNIKTQDKILQALLNDPFTLSGRIIRNNQGLITRQIRLYNDSISLSSNGLISTNKAFIDAAFHLKNMALLNKNIQGPLDIKLAGRGHNRFIHLAITSQIHEASIQNKKIKNFRLVSNLIIDQLSASKNYISGLISGKGLYNGEPLIISGDLLNDESQISIKNGRIIMQNTNLVANLSKHKNSNLVGNISLNAKNIDDLFGLFLIDAKGRANINMNFYDQKGIQNVDIKANANNLEIEDNVLKQLNINACIQNLYHKPKIEGQMELNQLQLFYKNKQKHATSLIINKISASGKSINNDNELSIETLLQNDGHFSAKALVQHLQKKTKITLKNLQIFDNTDRVKLAKPADIDIQNKHIAIQNFRLENKNGFASLNGIFAEKLDLALNLNNFSLDIINKFLPNLQLHGRASGAIQIGGLQKKPNITFNIKGQDIKSLSLEDYKIDPINVNAKGQFKDNNLALTSQIYGKNLNLQANMDANFLKNLPKDSNFNLILFISALPAQWLEKPLHITGLSGTIKGQIKANGTFHNPYASYQLTSANLLLNSLKIHNIHDIHALLTGELKEKKLQISEFSLKSHKGLNATASGDIALMDKRLNIAVEGVFPMEFLNQYMAQHGSRIGGILTGEAKINGPWLAPEMVGHFTIKKGNFFETNTNINIMNIDIEGELKDKTVQFNKIQGQSQAGGTVEGTGNILLDFEKNLPAEFKAKLNKYVYAYDTMVLTTINASLTIGGALLKDPLIEGNIHLLNTEITIPSNMHNVQTINVAHKNLSPDILRTLERADPNKKPKQFQNIAKKDNILHLNVHISAPNHVFIRGGGGLNVELGGALTVTGSINHLHPVGDLQLIRGRYDLGSQKLNFDEGHLDFTGNIDPDINLKGQSSTSDIAVIVEVTGTLTDLKMTFSSTPPLPQDEILAHLLFNTSLNELSPLQMAQIVFIAAELSGVRSSILDSIRNHIGFDDIDVLTNDNGSVGVKVGAYLRNNLYLGLEATSKDKAKVDLNYNFTNDLKAKGSLRVDGQSSLGVFFEKDY